MTSAHPGGFEVKFWFDPSDNLWHANNAIQEYTDTTLEGVLKQSQSVFAPLSQYGNIDACFAVAIGDKS